MALGHDWNRTPRKISMEHNNEGLVQMILLFANGWFSGSIVIFFAIYLLNFPFEAAKNHAPYLSWTIYMIYMHAYMYAACGPYVYDM